MAENELIVKENLDVALLFAEKDELKKKLKEIEAEVLSVVPDLSTAKGRKEIASLAFKVAKSKVVLDSLGKDLVSDWKIRAAKVDESRKYAREFLDALKDKVRQPLTDWEAAEEARIKAEAEALKFARDWDDAHSDHVIFLRLKELERKEAELARIQAEAEEKERLRVEEEARIAAEKAAEERRKQEAIERVEREKRIAEEAAAEAKKDAEEKLHAERKAAEQLLIDAEAKRIRDLAQAQAKADAEKKAAAEAEERAKIQAEQKRLADIQAEKDKAEAEKRAMIEAQAKKDREAEAALVRVTRIEDRMRAIADIYLMPSLSSSEISELIDSADRLYTGYDFEEYSDQAALIYTRAIKIFSEARDERNHIETRKAEAEATLVKEKARIEAEKAEEVKRQANVAHQKKINREAMASLMLLPGIDEPKAKAIVTAIVSGKIANVFIKY